MYFVLFHKKLIELEHSEQFLKQINPRLTQLKCTSEISHSFRWVKLYRTYLLFSFVLRVGCCPHIFRRFPWNRRCILCNLNDIKIYSNVQCYMQCPVIYAMSNVICNIQWYMQCPMLYAMSNFICNMRALRGSYLVRVRYRKADFLGVLWDWSESAGSQNA